MDPELKKLLEENLAVSKNNNDILRSIRHHQWLSGVATVVVWIFVLAVPFYLYQHYLQPFVDRFSGTSATSTPSGFFGFPSSADIQKLIDSYKPGAQ